MFKLLSFSLLLSTATAFCPLNSALSGSRPKCFAFYNYPLTFDQADTFCYNLGGRLASITDAFESATISSQVRADSPTVNAFWIGARSVDNRTYTWADGTPFTYQRWASGEPRYPCGVVQLSSSSWLTEQCPTMLPFACALDPSGTNPPCESGWSWRQPEAACYKIIRNFDTFDSAENGCKSIGAHLASIHTSSENDWIYDQGTANYKLGVTEHDLQTWIGLKRDCQSCQWYWTDGSALNYTQWTKDEPADDYSNQNCVEIYTDDATGLGSSNVRNWNNVKCDNAKRNAICKKPQNR
ncbi:unnamed protein product, partial [Mesorhabditis belari]|uniref:C-type lectin domain-containing protein n=1 Tax=Mesorhabditis belari TaxID=2138241 RepID=A0AAF3EUI5_9BILA